MRKCRLKRCRKELPSVKESNAIQKAGFCTNDHRYEHEGAKRPADKPKTAAKPKKKLKSIAALRNDVAELVQRLVRLKEADEHGFCQCWTCSARKHWKQMQGGHYIERGKSATKMLEENIHPQCQQCNQWGMKKTSVVLEYRNKMIDFYGADFVVWLEQESKRVVKHERGELMALIETYKTQIQALEEQVP